MTAWAARFSVLSACALALPGCGSDQRAPTTARPARSDQVRCTPPDLMDFNVIAVRAQRVTCSTAGAVAVAGTDCYFASLNSECPRVVVGGTTWDCAFQIVGPPGSGGLSRAVCFAGGREEVAFRVQRR
jgi:hypothetical protein